MPETIDTLQIKITTDITGFNAGIANVKSTLAGLKQTASTTSAASSGINSSLSSISVNAKKTYSSIKTNMSGIKTAFSGFSSGAGGAIAAAGAIGVAAVGIATAAKTAASGIMSCVEASSDLREVQNVVDTVFKSEAAEIDAWALNVKKSFGLSELSAKKYASTMGAILKSSGISGDNVKSMSTSLTGLAADMASFYNLDADTAFEKIRSGITGETEPLKQLGINMSVANLEAYALSQGITKSYNAMSQAEQILLRYNYLLHVTTDAQGDFERTSDSWANQTRILSQNWSELKSVMGEFWIEVLTPMVRSLNSILEGLILIGRKINEIFGIGGGSETKGSNAMEEIAESVDQTTEGLQETQKEVKRLDNLIAGIDELHIIKPDEENNSDTSKGSTSAGSIKPDNVNPLKDSIDDTNDSLIVLIDTLKEVPPNITPIRDAAPALKPLRDGAAEVAKELKEIQVPVLTPVQFPMPEGIDAFKEKVEEIRTKFSEITDAVAVPMQIPIPTGLPEIIIAFSEIALVAVTTTALINSLKPVINVNINANTQIFSEIEIQAQSLPREIHIYVSVTSDYFVLNQIKNELETIPPVKNVYVYVYADTTAIAELQMGLQMLQSKIVYITVQAETSAITDVSCQLESIATSKTVYLYVYAEYSALMIAAQQMNMIQSKAVVVSISVNTSALEMANALLCSLPETVVVAISMPGLTTAIGKVAILSGELAIIGAATVMGLGPANEAIAQLSTGFGVAAISATALTVAIGLLTAACAALNSQTGGLGGQAVMKTLSAGSSVGSLTSGVNSLTASASIFSLSPPSIPELAGGGVLRRATTVIAGEYPGAYNNPEIVTPQKLLQQIVTKANENMAADIVSGLAGIIAQRDETTAQTLTTSISGNDLLFVVEQARKKKGTTLSKNFAFGGR